MWNFGRVVLNSGTQLVKRILKLCVTNVKNNPNYCKNYSKLFYFVGSTCRFFKCG